MSQDFNTNTKNNDEWLTPPYVISALGEFDIDPCSPVCRPWDTANNHFNVNDDGLLQEWKGRVWLNPPYGNKTFEWLSKLAEHKNGIALIFSRTETKGFHKEIWEKAHSIFFFKGRLSFYKVTGEKASCANAPSCLVSYDNDNTYTINRAVNDNKLKGRHIFL